MSKFEWVDCGCQSRVVQYGLSERTEIAFCRLHAAAPEMIGLLRDLIDWMDIKTQGVTGTTTFKTVIKKLIAEIEGGL